MKILAPFFTLGFLLCFISCTDDSTPGKDLNSYAHGVIITNEGTYDQNNGSISYLSADLDTIIPDLFFLANGRSLGDVVQSFSVAGNLGVIVVNNSKKVEVVNLSDFKSVGFIQASYPRYFCYAGNNKGYLTSAGFPGEVLVINTATVSVMDTILVGNQPEHLIISNNMIFVANGKWGNDNTVSVIDPLTDSVVKTITVGDGPTDLVETVDNNIWVICQGKVIYNNDWTEIISETDSKLVCINPVTLEKTSEIVIGTMGDGFNPYVLTTSPDKNIIYYVEVGGIHTFNPLSMTYSGNPIITGFFYGLGINPANGDIFALESKGYTVNGAVHVYSSEGEHVNTYETGIAPNGVVFY